DDVPVVLGVLVSNRSAYRSGAKSDGAVQWDVDERELGIFQRGDGPEHPAPINPGGYDIDLVGIARPVLDYENRRTGISRRGDAGAGPVQPTRGNQQKKRE